MSDENKLECVPCGTTACVTTSAPPPVPDVQVTAENADEMAACQSAIIEWCKAKVARTKQEHKELEAAYKHAVKCKWKNDTLKRHSDLARKRWDFYGRMLEALEHGYQIVPSFPITAFAIRTNREKPLRMWTTNWSKSHTQSPPGLDAGEGKYKNPFPLVQDWQLNPATQTQAETREYYATHWDEVEFPMSMAKPKIMEAATRAMALKIFDDIGILPGYAPSEGTRPPQGDPIIVARMLVPNWPSANKRWVSFIIAWHLDTSTL